MGCSSSKEQSDAKVPLEVLYLERPLNDMDSAHEGPGLSESAESLPQMPLSSVSDSTIPEDEDRELRPLTLEAQQDMSRLSAQRLHTKPFVADEDEGHEVKEFRINQMGEDGDIAVTSTKIPQNKAMKMETQNEELSEEDTTRAASTPAVADDMVQQMLLVTASAEESERLKQRITEAGLAVKKQQAEQDTKLAAKRRDEHAARRQAEAATASAFALLRSLQNPPRDATATFPGVGEAMHQVTAASLQGRDLKSYLAVRKSRDKYRA